MTRPLTVVAPGFLAERLARTPPRGVALHVITWEDGPLPRAAQAADVFVPWVTDRAATRDAISGLPATSWVCAISSGIDWFIEAVPPGVLVTGAKGLRSEACAEWVVAVTLYLVRGLGEFADRQRARIWAPSCFGSLSGATVLLLGYGAIGQAVERRMRPFGCTFVRVAEREREGVLPASGLAPLIGEADVIVVAIPLTGSTAGLVGREFLAAMRAGAVLVNVARGPIVDMAALAGAVRDGRIRAAVDVTDPEPLPAGDPLFGTAGLLITPHVSGVVPGFPERAHTFVSAQIERKAYGLAPLDIRASSVARKPSRQLA